MSIKASIALKFYFLHLVPSFPPSSEGYCDKNLTGIPQQGSLGGNLISTLSGNDITSGFMFDVVAISDIIVTGIDLHIVSGESYSEIRLYATCCNLISYDQVKRHPRAWKLSGSIKVQGSGYGQLTSLSNMNFEYVCIEQGSSKGFYITSPDGNIFYLSKVGQTGDVYKSDEHLSLLVGIGKEYWLSPNNVENRVFNGQLHYMHRNNRIFEYQKISSSCALGMSYHWVLALGLIAILF